MPTKSRASRPRVSAPEALIYAMVTTSAVDHEMTSDEIARIGSAVRELPAFAKYGDDWFSGAAQDCGRLLAKAGGVETVIEVIKDALPGHLGETAYVLASEVAAVDLAAHPQERRFLDMLAAALGIDPLICTALERAARARHQTP